MSNIPTIAINNINSFLSETKRIRRMVDFNFNKIFSMDETLIYFTAKSYEFRHVRKLKANIGDASYSRISVAFGASATGQKLPIFMILPRSTPLVNEDGSVYEPPQNVLIRYKPCGTFNQDVIIDYFKTIKDNELIEDGNNKSIRFFIEYLLNVLYN